MQDTIRIKNADDVIQRTTEQITAAKQRIKELKKKRGGYFNPSSSVEFLKQWSGAEDKSYQEFLFKGGAIENYATMFDVDIESDNNTSAILGGFKRMKNLDIKLIKKLLNKI